MYPSRRTPYYGIFVKNFKDTLECNKIHFSKMSLIKGKPTHIFSKIFAYLKLYISVLRNYFTYDYDIIYTHYLSHNSPILFFLLILTKKKQKIVINVHGSDIVNSEGSFIDIINKFVLKRIDLLVVPSIYFKELIINNYPFFSEDKIFVSPSGGINLDLFEDKKDSKNEECLSLGFVSRIDKGKGWDIFLRGLARLNNDNINFKADVAGGGSEIDEFKKTIVKLNLSNKINYKGVIDHSKLVDFYNSIDVFIFPSERKAESLGLVGLESMACGTPVVGSNIGGIKTYLQDGFNGFLFESGNEKDLIEKIKLFKSLSVKDKAEMKENALQTALKYDSKYISRKLISKLEELMEYESKIT